MLEQLINDPQGFLAAGSQVQEITLKYSANVVEAEAKIAALAAQLGLIKDTTLNVTALVDDTEVSSWQAPVKQGIVFYKAVMLGGESLRAAGGQVHAASGMGAYTVGEIGPEPFFPATNGRILSNSEAKSAMRSNYRQGGGETVNVIINTPVNLADRVWVERELEPYIRKAIRQARG